MIHQKEKWRRAVDKALAEKLKSIITERGLKLVHISNTLGISQSYFNLLVNGRRPISPELRQRIGEYLGVVL